MGRRNPESTSRPHIVVAEAVHARLRVLSAQKNLTMKLLVEELLKVYDAHTSTGHEATPTP